MRYLPSLAALAALVSTALTSAIGSSGRRTVDTCRGARDGGARPAARSPFGGGGGRAARLRSPIDGPAALRFHRFAAACALAALALACADCSARRRRQLGRARRSAPSPRQGVLGSSAANFAPQAPLTQAALADAIRATDDLQHAPSRRHRPAADGQTDARSSIAANATIGGLVPWQVDAPGRAVDHVDFALDGKTHKTDRAAPYDDVLDTRALPDGPHQLAVNVTFADGGSAIAALDRDGRECSRCDPDAGHRPRHGGRLEVLGAAAHDRRSARRRSGRSTGRLRRRRPSRSSSSTRRSSATSGSATRRARSRRR